VGVVGAVIGVFLTVHQSTSQRSANDDVEPMMNDVARPPHSVSPVAETLSSS